METTKRAIVRELKIAMMDAGVTRTDMAAVAGVSRPYISQVLSGGEYVSFKQLGRLYQAFEEVVEAKQEERPAKHSGPWLTQL